MRVQPTRTYPASTPTPPSPLPYREQPIPHTLLLFRSQQPEKALQELSSCVWAGGKERGTKRGLSLEIPRRARRSADGSEARGGLDADARVLGRGELSCYPRSFSQPAGAVTRSQGKCFDHSESDGLESRQSQHSQAIRERSLGGGKWNLRRPTAAPCQEANTWKELCLWGEAHPTISVALSPPKGAGSQRLQRNWACDCQAIAVALRC